MSKIIYHHFTQKVARQYNSAKLMFMNYRAETWIELNQDAFSNNIKHLRNVIGDHAILSVVVKGNSYGHGLQTIATLCQNNSNVNWLCAVSLSEALTLRSFGVTKPILVLSLIDESPARAIEHDIDLMISDESTAREIHWHAQALKKQARVHLKVDTGMSRFGFTPDAVLSTIDRLAQLPYLTIHGIATHFSNTSDKTSEFTPLQSTRFKDLLETLAVHNIDIPLKHTSNSAATLHHPMNHYNFVRVGAAAYGLLPDNNQMPIATWKTTISCIRTIAADQFIGYDLTHKTTRESRIAILPVGYYHGYSRTLSNNSVVLVHVAATNSMKYAPVVGRVCMNQILIDITSIENSAVDDEVILMGPYDHVRPYDIAQRTQSFNPREITTTINTSIPRIIVTEQRPEKNLTKNAKQKELS